MTGTDLDHPSRLEETQQYEQHPRIETREERVPVVEPIGARPAGIRVPVLAAELASLPQKPALAIEVEVDSGEPVGPERLPNPATLRGQDLAIRLR